VSAYYKRYRLDREQGIDRSYIDAAPVVAHLRVLIAAGGTCRGLALAAGVSSTTVSKMLREPRPRCQRRVAARLLDLTPASIRNRADPEGLVPALGSKRRIQALLAIGWRHQDITDQMRSGTSYHSQLVLHRPGDHVTQRTAEAVQRAYRALAGRPGPSRSTQRRALAAGYVSPAAWDDIDDPLERPQGIGVAPRTNPRQRVHLDDLELLIDEGFTAANIAARLGCSMSAVEIYLRRHDRVDLLRRLQTAA